MRSIRAPALVRIKLIELHSLPSHSPVYALILLSEAESLVRSFHLLVPNIVYETFLRSPLSIHFVMTLDSIHFPGQLMITPVKYILCVLYICVYTRIFKHALHWVPLGNKDAYIRNRLDLYQ